MTEFTTDEHDEGTEDTEQPGYRVTQFGDLEKAELIERSLTEAEAQLRLNEEAQKIIIKGAIAIMRLKLFFVKYSGNESEESKIIESYAKSYPNSPLYYISRINEYAFRTLRIKYNFGLKKRMKQPWEKHISSASDEEATEEIIEAVKEETEKDEEAVAE